MRPIQIWGTGLHRLWVLQAEGGGVAIVPTNSTEEAKSRRFIDSVVGGPMTRPASERVSF